MPIALEWPYVYPRFEMYRKRAARNLRAYFRTEQGIRNAVQTTTNTPQRTTISKPPLKRPRPGKESKK